MHSFDRLLSPVNARAFTAETWQRAPLHIERDAPSYFADLGGLAAVDEVLGGPEPPVDTLRVIDRGVDLPESCYLTWRRLRRSRVARAVDMARLTALYRRGATVVCSVFDQALPALDRFCRTLEDELGFPVEAHLYATPRGGKAFGPHWDNHDVFVVQLEGAKDWVVMDRPCVEAPLPHQIYAPDALGLDRGPPLRFRVRAGDTLYVPRGFVHQAACTSDHSVHLAISVTATTWADVLARAIGELATRDLRLREALPIGYARDDRALAEAADRVPGAIAALHALLVAAADRLVVTEARRSEAARRRTPRPALGLVERP
jgi:hypothetical protein